MTPETMKQLSAYSLQVATMDLADIPRLHELSVSVSWPHRPEDWAALIRYGDGIVARDEIDRVVGSAMWFPFGPRHVTIGMVITSPRLQSYGAGHWLMRHVLQQAGKRHRILNATREATRLYISLGFTPIGRVYQHQGIVRQVRTSSANAREATAADHPAILALDYEATGVDRSKLLDDLLVRSRAVVTERKGVIRGVALCHRFGRGHTIGPVIAETESDAMAVVQPHLEAHQGRFLRLDLREMADSLRDFVSTAGMPHYDTLTRMKLGPLPEVADTVQPFGVVSHTLG